MCIIACIALHTLSTTFIYKCMLGTIYTLTLLCPSIKVWYDSTIYILHPLHIAERN